MFNRQSRVVRLVVGLAGLAIVVGACGGGGSGKYSIGILEHGGSRQRLARGEVCTIKAQALVSGKVETLTTIHRDTDAAGQLEDIRDLIATGVNAIVFNPDDPDGPQPGPQGGQGRRHRVGRGRPVRDRARHAYMLSNNQASTGTSAPSGCSRSSAARATSTTCAASPAPGRHRPRHRLPEGARRVPGHRGPSDHRRRAHAVGLGQGERADERLHRQRQVRRDRRHLDVGHRPARSSTPSRPPARRSCRSSARTAAAS